MWKKNGIKSGWGCSHKCCLKELGKLKSLNRISFRLFIYLFELPRRKFPAATNGTCEEEPSEKVGTWDFVESSQRSYCSCSRSVDVQFTQVLLICVRSKTFQRGYMESTGLWTPAQRAILSKISASYICVWTLTSILFFTFFNLSLFCVSDSRGGAETSAGLCVSVSQTFLFPHWLEWFQAERIVWPLV